MFEPTNTFASANFDILKMDAIEDPLINLNRLATLDFEESYTAKVIDFINESRKELTENKIKFYKNLNEATNEIAVLESFSDFCSAIKDIIAKFIKFLRKLVDKFLATFMSLVKSDKYINKHKDVFNRLESDLEFDFDGYEYTFSPMIPLPTAAVGFNNDLFSDLYGDTKNSLTTTSVKDSIANMDLEKSYDEFRAKVIGKDGEIISIIDFADELFSVYRNGETTTSSITANPEYIRKCYYRFSEYDKIKKEVEHQKSETEKAYLKIQDQVKDISKRSIDLDKQALLNRLPSNNGITTIGDGNESGSVLAAEFMIQVDMYVKAKVDQIQEYSNIHLLAFGAKLDALKECAKQDRNVLYSALRKTKVPLNKKGGR